MAMHYEPLDESKDEIRLLTLLPRAQRTRTEVVHCRLKKISMASFTTQYKASQSSSGFSASDMRKSRINWIQSLSQSEGMLQGIFPTTIQEPPEEYQRFTWGDYAALSYVWGDERRTSRIKVNGYEMEVTQNLEAALRALRNGSEFHSKFGLWVDAICINQKDLVERGRQVTKMRHIYGKAWNVIAWLGEEREQSSRAIQLVQSLSQFHDTLTGNNDLASRLSEEPGWLGGGCWYALNQLMARPYWDRLWIIQEIVMGASAMVLRCGTSSIDWDSFCLGIKVLQEELWLVKDELLQRDVARAGGASQPAAWSTTSLHLVYRDLSVLSQRDEAGEVGLPFWRLIDIANSAECKDPRDKVYGLIGLMDGNVGKELEPNYKIPPREVYTEVSKAFMKTYQTLDPIREGGPWGPTKTPSWVADWMWDGGRLSQARIENRLWGPAWLSGESIPDSSVYRPYEASFGGTMDISFLDTGLLACTGFVTDTITGLSARGRGFFAWSMASIVQAKEWKSIYGNRDETSKALYRCLVADRVGGGQIPSDRHAVILNLPSTFSKAKLQFEKRGWSWLASQDNYYFRWEEWRKANRNFQMGDWPFNDFFSDIIPADALEHDFTEVYACFDRTCQKRRFIITEKGYMGWAPDNIHGSVRDQTMGGDLIAILLGCSTPVVIRPKGDYFKVIGEAYVQGIMDGEAMDFLKEGKVERRTFTSC